MAQLPRLMVVFSTCGRHRLAALTATVAGAARRHELADGPDDLPLELPPLERRPLLVGAAVAAAADVLVVELHVALPLCFALLLLRFDRALPCSLKSLSSRVF